MIKFFRQIQTRRPTVAWRYSNEFKKYFSLKIGFQLFGLTVSKTDYEDKVLIVCKCTFTVTMKIVKLIDRHWYFRNYYLKLYIGPSILD